MNKDTFQSLTLEQQLSYVNKQLATNSMRTISASLGIHKNTIPSLFKKNGYGLDFESKTYVKNTIVNDSVAIDTNVSETKIVPSNRNIVINKNENKITPRRISYYLKPNTIEKIEELSKKSNKGISEFLQNLFDTILDDIEIK